MNSKIYSAIFIHFIAAFFSQSFGENLPRVLPIDAAEFERRMDSFYSPLDDWRQVFELDIEGQRVRVDGEADWIDLESSASVKQRNYNVGDWPHVVLDPGHLGGEWGPLEGRSFAIGDGPVFQEGDAVLAVAKRVQELLRDYKIKLSLTRSDATPVNPKRPSDYIDEASRWVQETRPDLSPQGQKFEWLVQNRANLLFYRSGEIEARAHLVNQSLKPDLVVCLHINAGAWENPQRFSLREENNLHILVHGNYMSGELASVEARTDLMHKIANGTFEKERSAAEVFLKIFHRRTQLPAYKYGGKNALLVDEAGYLWARNLAANRKYHAPVVFLEPYIANSIDGYARITAGDYQGRKRVQGVMQLSLVEEYARAVASSLFELYGLEKR